MAAIIVHDRPVPAPVYLQAIRAAKRLPDATFRQTLHSWTAGTGAQIMREYRRDLHQRINQRGGIDVPKGRVSLHDWGLISVPRLILDRHTVRSLNRHQKPRFADRERSW